MRKKTECQHLSISDSSGNVFEDLKRPNAEEQKLKVQLATAINHAIQGRRLRQIDAARELNASQPDISDLANYKLANFSVSRLMNYLTHLHRDVEIAIRPAPSRGHVSVREFADA